MTVAVTPTSPADRLTALVGPDTATALIGPSSTVTADDVASARAFLDRLPEAEDAEVAARIGSSNPRVIAALRALCARTCA